MLRCLSGGLSVNIKKNKYMLLSKKRPLKDPATSLVINNYPIERAKEFKDSAFLRICNRGTFSWNHNKQMLHLIAMSQAGTVPLALFLR